MYRHFYHLKYAPFATTPISDGLFVTPRHKAALDHLSRGIAARQGVMLFLGETGLGKTTLLRACLMQGSEPSVKTLYINNSTLSYDNSKAQFRDLVKSIYRELGVETEERNLSEMIRHLHEIFIAEYKQGVNIVIIVDDAHLLSGEILKSLTQLIDIFPYQERLVQLILVGQPQLEKQLHTTELRELEERIRTIVKIQPLTTQESESYIQQQLAQASTSGEPIFSKAALNQIVHYTRGVPRDMNILCTDVLIAGSQQEKQPIPASIVRRVIAEFEPTRTSRLPRLTWFRAACVLLLVGVSGALLYSKLSYVPPATSVSPAVSEPPQAVMQVSPPARPFDRSEPSPHSDEIAATPPAASTPMAAPVEVPLERPQPVAPSEASEPLASPALPPALAIDDRPATSPLPAIANPPATLAETSAPPSADPTASSRAVMNQVEALMQRLYPDGGDFQLEVWGNKKAERVYVEGEKLLLHVLADTDAYLQVDYYQADGQVVHLLPHALVDNRVQAGRIFTLGKPEHMFQFNIAPPFGEEMLVVIASQQPLALPTGMSSNVELASLYTERLANQLQTYQAQGQIAVASLRIRTQKSHGTRLSQTTPR